MSAPSRLHFCQAALATEVEIVLDAEGDREACARIAEAAFEEVRRLEQQLSAHLPTSDICWINRNAAQGPVRVEAQLFGLLQRAATLHAQTGGAFDLTIGSLVKCWGFFRREGAVPPAEALAQARSRVGMQQVELDPRERTVRFRRPGVELNLGAIGKGYVVDRVRAALCGWGVRCALVHTGSSSIGAVGEAPGGGGWRVGLRHPEGEGRRLGVVALRDESLSSSALAEQQFVADGVTYGHLLDPRTGWPVPSGQTAGVWVRGPSAAETDALSTALFVMGPEAAQAYCGQRSVRAAIACRDPAGGLSVQDIGFELEQEESPYEPQGRPDPAGVPALHGSRRPAGGDGPAGPGPGPRGGR